MILAKALPSRDQVTLVRRAHSIEYFWFRIATRRASWSVKTLVITHAIHPHLLGDKQMEHINFLKITLTNCTITVFWNLRALALLAKSERKAWTLYNLALCRRGFLSDHGWFPSIGVILFKGSRMRSNRIPRYLRNQLDTNPSTTWSLLCCIWCGVIWAWSRREARDNTTGKPQFHSETTNLSEC